MEHIHAFTCGQPNQSTLTRGTQSQAKSLRSNMKLPATLLFSSFLLLLLHPSPSSANEGNILITGDVLTTDSQLSYAGNVFVIQDDCNLVLYNKGSGFESNTHGFGTNCTLTVTNRGQLLIRAGGGFTVWTSPATGKPGTYAAVLRPDGQVSIYGPSVWSIPPLRSGAASTDVGEELATLPPVRNLLFSGQTLYDDSKLASRDYTLAVTDDCNLEFRKASVGVVWESKTKGKGKHCFLRLDHRGELAVVDDGYRVVWSSGKTAAEGEYVLAVQINGQAVVYGPAIWSTA
ncbi:Mannose-specific lectin 3 [Apostasia shenzhenica]|uniref:Mannose-specific lectin 3 n=1 Tax=Apostasia shenzhenica TaxID=1088818 RepID=A0A2I0B5P1_9ASPA|nr:Mannose-specific lectin 3 [Apostasia shenzhenica]